MNHPLKGPAVASGLIHFSLLALVSGVSGLGLSSPLEVRIPIEIITVGETDAPASQRSMLHTGRIRKDRLRAPGGWSAGLQRLAHSAYASPGHVRPIDHRQPHAVLLPAEGVIPTRPEAIRLSDP